MLIFRKRPATILRIPSLALMLLAPWAMLESTRLMGAKHSPQATFGFALAVCAAFALGFRITRRVGDEIVSTGLTGSRYVLARHAVLGIRMRGGGKYWQLRSRGDGPPGLQQNGFGSGHDR
jgi:hypothetical protein